MKQHTGVSNNKKQQASSGSKQPPTGKAEQKQTAENTRTEKAKSEKEGGCLKQQKQSNYQRETFTANDMQKEQKG